MKLHADEVQGDRARRQRRAHGGHGHVVVDSPRARRPATPASTTWRPQVIHLTGHVVLTKRQNVMRGTALEVDMATGHRAA